MVGKESGVALWTRPILRQLAHRRNHNSQSSLADGENEAQLNEEGGVGGTFPITDRSDCTMPNVYKKRDRVLQNEGLQTTHQQHCQGNSGSLMNILRAAPLAEEIPNAN